MLCLIACVGLLLLNHLEFGPLGPKDITVKTLVEIFHYYWWI